MKTIQDVFIQFRQQLAALYEASELQSVTLFALNEVTGKSNAQLKAFPETKLSEAERAKIEDVLKQLATGMPVQYAVGQTEFYGLPFEVTPDVLIPRPETEELVDWILREITERKWTKPKILDIGTGSGCIAITLQKNIPQATVSAIDISEAALQVAKENAAMNKVDVDFIKSDILQADFAMRNQFDVIVSNPPYVTQQDKLQMNNRVTDFEPHTALFVPDENPLLFYKAIANFAVQHLKPQGLLFYEINESLGNETVEMLSHKGFINIELKKDMFGKDRMVRAAL